MGGGGHNSEGVDGSNDFASRVFDRRGKPFHFHRLAVSSFELKDDGIGLVSEEDAIDSILGVAPIDFLAEDFGDGFVGDVFVVDSEEGGSGAVPLDDVSDFVDRETRKGEFLEQGLVALKADHLNRFELLEVGAEGRDFTVGVIQGLNHVGVVVNWLFLGFGVTSAEDGCARKGQNAYGKSGGENWLVRSREGTRRTCRHGSRHQSHA